MPTPSEKFPEMTNFLDKLIGRTDSIENSKCTTCGKDASKFTDELSRKEYKISGLCQECQDQVFGYYIESNNTIY